LIFFEKVLYLSGRIAKKKSEIKFASNDLCGFAEPVMIESENRLDTGKLVKKNTKNTGGKPQMGFTE